MTCGCGASFCFHDWENDAHEHVCSLRRLVGHEPFTLANQQRQWKQVVEFSQSIEKESFEVQNLVRISDEQSFPENSTSRSISGERPTVTSLLTKAQNTLSLASQTIGYRFWPITNSLKIELNLRVTIFQQGVPFRTIITSVWILKGLVPFATRFRWKG